MSVPKAATDRSEVIGPIGAFTDAQALAYWHQQSLQARIEQMRAGFEFADLCLFVLAFDMDTAEHNLYAQVLI